MPILLRPKSHTATRFQAIVDGENPVNRSRNKLSKTTVGFISPGMAYLVAGLTLGALFFIFPETRAFSTHMFVYNIWRTLM